MALSPKRIFGKLFQGRSMLFNWRIRPWGQKGWTSRYWIYKKKSSTGLSSSHIRQAHRNLLWNFLLQADIFHEHRYKCNRWSKCYGGKPYSMYPHIVIATNSCPTYFVFCKKVVSLLANLPWSPLKQLCLLLSNQHYQFSLTIWHIFRKFGQIQRIMGLSFRFTIQSRSKGSCLKRFTNIWEEDRCNYSICKSWTKTWRWK